MTPTTAGCVPIPEAVRTAGTCVRVVPIRAVGSAGGFGRLPGSGPLPGPEMYGPDGGAGFGSTPASPFIPASDPGGRLLRFPRFSSEPQTEAPQPHPAADLAAHPRDRQASISDRSALAHDARNALASIQLVGGMLAEPDCLPQQHASLAGDLLQAAARLDTLIGQLANAGSHAHKQADAPHPPARPVGVVLASCRRILQLTAGPRVAVHVSAESRLNEAAMPDATLERILVNLIKNAAEAMPQGGTVRVTARKALSRSAPAVLVHVSDTGPGIPAHALQHIFEPGFTSKQRTQPWQPECGLGLTIVRQLVEESGGTVQVASTRRRGTTFELRIPLTGSSC